MIPDFGCCGVGRWSLVVSGPRTTYTLIGEPQLCEHEPFRLEAASYLFAKGPPTPPLPIGIIELQGIIVKVP
jgi:hypothetical protein